LAGEFLDSNVLIYAFTTDRRAETARALLGRGCTISVQGLNEFANVARRKLGKSWQETRDALAAIRSLCPRIVAVDLNTHQAALTLAERYSLALFDALMLAAALQAGSDTIWSEDMQDGMVVDARLRIANPFNTNPCGLPSDGRVPQ
jgi:predicted nucleic acid-binding protein